MLFRTKNGILRRANLSFNKWEVLVLAETFRKGQLVAYQDKGVGKIESIGEVEVSGHRFNGIVIEFESGKITIPTAKASVSGLRLVNSDEQLPDILKMLKQKPKKMAGRWWKAKADVYRLKLTSGDLRLIAEIIRDLYCEDESFSPSEMDIYRTACKILVEELSAIKNLPATEILQLLKQETKKVLYYSEVPGFTRSATVTVKRKSSWGPRVKSEVKSEKMLSRRKPKVKPSAAPKEPISSTKIQLENSMLRRQVEDYEKKLLLCESGKQTVLAAELHKAERAHSLVVNNLENQIKELRQELKLSESECRKLEVDIEAVEEKINAAVETVKRPLLLQVNQLESGLTLLKEELAKKDAVCEKLHAELKLVKENSPAMAASVIPSGKTSRPKPVPMMAGEVIESTSSVKALKGLVRRADGSWWNPKWK